MPAAKEHVRTTCPRDCYDACGIVVVKRGGEITRVLGDPKHPVSRGALCGKCALAYNGVVRDPTARLITPLRRVGPKGKGRFEPVSWEAALAIVADRLAHIAATSGPESIIHTHYTGTCSLIAGNFPQRFFNRLGATEVEPDTICNNAGHVALRYVYGTSTIGFDPRMARFAKCILVWGANPSASAPHAHKHWLKEAPGKVIVVDPIRHPTAAAANLHLQPYPGSDAALAFALAHVLKRDGLLDRHFIAANVIGWDEVESVVAGCDPAWGEAKTGVPAALIEEAARAYGDGPSLLWLGQGLQRQPMGGNVFRACAMLPAITGNIGKIGAGFYYLNGTARRGIDEAYLTAPQLRQSHATPISHMDLAERLEDRARAHALISWNMNVAASGPHQQRLHKALARDDLFTLAVDLFATDTTDFADIVLPAASFLEFDDLVASYFNLTISAQVKATEPIGEALPNQEIFRRLARAMRFAEPELYESDAEIIATLLSQARLEGGFAALAASGTVQLWLDPVIQFPDLTFPTPSGRIEIVSETARKDGLPAAPLPHADARPSNGRLRLLSPASPWLMNDSYANDSGIAQRLGPASVTVNALDAAERGLTEGHSARLSNEVGSLVLRVAIGEEVPRGVALAHKGRWPKRENQHANVNSLNPGLKTDMGESTSVHAVEVLVTPASSP
ncbi:MAG TPA: molybdopterin-dependent oxidoreductase [Alphaproteobacteria bacterium]|nr:molybdopterin-dependent oxidoreductase [Alphaproteobacteria bacterium]